MSKRIERVNQLIKKELSQILLKAFDHPQDILVTITRAETSADLSQVKVYVSCIPVGGGWPLRIIQDLNSKIYLLQHQLNERLKMRKVPKISFWQETKTAEAEQVERLLEEIRGNSSKIKKINRRC